MYFYNEHFINLIVGVMVSLLASSAILQKWYLLLLTDWLTESRSCVPEERLVYLRTGASVSYHYHLIERNLL
jgi:hypothetical protein